MKLRISGHVERDIDTLREELETVEDMVRPAELWCEKDATSLTFTLRVHGFPIRYERDGDIWRITGEADMVDDDAWTDSCRAIELCPGTIEVDDPTGYWDGDASAMTLRTKLMQDKLTRY